MDILQQLMEGGAACDTNPEDVKIDPATEKEIEESTMPITMLIESFHTQVESDINRAIEVYEMASIMGATQVLREGTNVQESAAAVMEGNKQGFLAKIIEKIKQIKDWFVGIIRKIMHKGKSDATVAEEKVKKAMPEAKKKVAAAEAASSSTDKGSDAGTDKGSGSKSIIYRGPTISTKSGDHYYDRIVNGLEGILIDLENTVNQTIKQVTDEKLDEKSVTTTSDAIAEEISKKAGGKATTMSEIVRTITESYVHVLGQNDKPIYVDAKVLSNMEAATKQATDIDKAGNNAIKKFSARCDSIRNKIEKVQNNYEYVEDGQNVVQMLGKFASSINAVAGAYSQVVNARIQAYVKTATAYAAFIDGLAKSGNKPEAAAESMNFNYMFESIDEVKSPMVYAEESEEFNNNAGIYVGEGINNSIFDQLGGFLSI